MLNFAEQTGSGAVMVVWSFLEIYPAPCVHWAYPISMEPTDICIQTCTYPLHVQATCTCTCIPDAYTYISLCLGTTKRPSSTFIHTLFFPQFFGSFYNILSLSSLLFPVAKYTCICMWPSIHVYVYVYVYAMLRRWGYYDTFGKQAHTHTHT